MKFKKIETEIKDLVIIEPTVFEDSRGFFLESYNYNDFKEIGIDNIFIQDNHSKSSKGVLRGLHFQKGEFAQAKLVRVLKGAEDGLIWNDDDLKIEWNFKKYNINEKELIISEKDKKNKSFLEYKKENKID